MRQRRFPLHLRRKTKYRGALMPAWENDQSADGKRPEQHRPKEFGRFENLMRKLVEVPSQAKRI